MTHDIKCPIVAPSLAFGNERVCQCELIKVVRDDERARQRVELIDLCIEARKK